MNAPRFSDFCASCRKSLAHVEKVLFVEKEIGRCFCGEECIHDYFSPTVEFLEFELKKFGGQPEHAETKRLSESRMTTISDADEIWASESESGDLYYTYIAHYRDKGDDSYTHVVLSLCLEGEPSYIFLSFATQDEDLVDAYRRGTDLRIHDGLETDEGAHGPVDNVIPLRSPGMEPVQQSIHVNELERICHEYRKADDIPLSDFSKFEPFIDPTLEDPDEIWTMQDKDNNQWFTFITNFSNDSGDSFTMIVVCVPKFEKGRKTLEILLSFPSIDPGLVQRFRQGINSVNKAFGIGQARAA